MTRILCFESRRLVRMDSWLGVTVPDSRIDLNQSFTFSFERDWKERDIYFWLKRTFPVTWISSGIYLIIIFPLRKYMENRRPFDLRRGMVLWSATLAIFSIIGTARTAPERWYTVTNYGWSHSVCNNELYTGPIALWYGLFITSKIYEFGDTIFIILRKQKLIFLHSYHHVTVLIFSWYVCSDVQIFARWFLVMNYFVHAVLYSYYTLRALKIRVPKLVAMSVTVLQTFQMACGIAMTALPYFLMRSGRRCDVTFFHLHVSFGIYGSYLILFGHFFYKTYMKRDEKVDLNGVNLKTE